MPREWMTDDERARSDRSEKWLRVEAWSLGFFQAALFLIGLRELLR